MHLKYIKKAGSTMVQWSNAEILVFALVGVMILIKLWTVWYVSLKAKANREGKFIFLGVITSITLFGIGAKFYIGMMMGL